MNIQPISYLQADPRWKNKPYYSTGSYNTIGNSGCGPTAAAMVVATMADPSVTPVEACAWSVAHGYRTQSNGTSFSLFTPYLATYGIDCQMLSWTNTYGKPDHANHQKVIDLLHEGYWIIAVMGPGTWTTGGHFILVWDVDEVNNVVYINDPASTTKKRTEGNLQTFKSQVKYYWTVDARGYNKESSDEEEEDMDKDRFKELWLEMRKDLQDNDSSAYSEEARQWAVSTGLIQGGDSSEFNGMWEDVMTREQLVTVLYRFAKLVGAA